jgi:hypothetical protein
MNKFILAFYNMNICKWEYEYSEFENPQVRVSPTNVR